LRVAVPAAHAAYIDDHDDRDDKDMNNCSVRLRPQPLRIGDVVVDPPLILAPMAGVADEVYRRIMAEHGAGLVTTEMVSVEGLRRSQPSTRKLCALDPSLKIPLAVQIFGGNPQAAAEAARLVEGMGASLIDINAGCPVRKVVRQGAGAALLREPGRLASMIEEVKKAVSLPVTVKIRVGWDERSTDPVGLARLVESAGADAIAVHARTAVQQYSGKADWSHITRVKAAVGIPVIGNGDIDRPSLADRMLRETGCDAVMVGRATMGNPWLLSSIAAQWGHPVNGGRCPGWEHFHETARSHVEAVLQKKPKALGHARQIFIWYSKGCPEISRLRSKLLATSEPHGMQDVFRQWVEENASREAPFLSVKVPESQSIGGYTDHHDREDGGVLR